MDSWVVVEFMPANEGDIPDCKAVPTTWLSESKGTLMCCYPSGMSDRQIIFIIASHALPDPSWSKFRVRKFPNSVCDSYEKARELELVAIDTSDVDADKVLGRGQRRKRVKYESDDESDYCPRRKMPSPPKMVKEPTASHKSVLVSHNVRSTEAAAIFMESAGPSTSCISAINADTSTSSDTFSSGGACNCGCKENKRMIDVLLKRVETTNVLLLEVVETTQSLVAAVNNLKERPSHVQGVPDVELNFPLRTVEDYEVMENDLKDVAFRELVKGVLKIHGGASLVTAVNGILYFAMTDALGKCFTYKGVPARNKFSFKDSRLDKLIFEVVQGRPSLANHSRKEVGKAVAEWLRQAGARDRRKQAKDAQPRLELL
ncbi:uncharacterized protein LOC124162719 isoform X1 [Ischnura elegans]|uniref:uncharacterized protein LOC124162719 isoform X1 n=1 Tax=Ischnura elegans TaxID=197161 RepID=UPI001ED86909|nr:uncharacterized protein LOC124162719 isoform X1 [Ischnura elegans]